MRTLDYSPDLMPEMIKTVSNLSSPSLAVRFARTFGGTKIYFPRVLYTAHPIVRCLGIRAAMRVAAVWVREAKEVPTAIFYLRWIDVRALEVAGVNRTEIGQLVGVSRRHVNRLLDGFKPDDIAVEGIVIEIAKHYGVNNRHLRHLAAVTDRSSPLQQDFGWPRAPQGKPITIG